ncbi:MAG: trypsin-like peptidase domain-containing protein [Anaerolineales bacterium]|jgi:S1-C subfamily serine protease
MDNNKNTRKWITCGLIGVMVVCVGVVIGLGGLATIGALFGDTTSTSDSMTFDQQVTPLSQPTNTISTIGDSGQPTLDTTNLKPIPYESVVQIIAMYYDENDQLVQGWTGSGSIITADGLILTNAHVVLPDRYFAVDALGVAFTVAEDRLPELLYFAEVVQADEPLDIAVIRITTDLNGAPVDPAALNLPFVPLGDADNLSLGDQITILGYPGIGGQTITLTRGEVSGFTSEPERGDRAFIKTSATIAGGNSGGLAADSEGYLIGIPSQLGYGGEDQFIDCRVLADTNRDGIVDDQDSCVPTGGFINALRPINLALPLIDAAKQGQVAIHHGGPAPTMEADLPPEGTVIYQDDFSTVKGMWTWDGSEGNVTYDGAELRINVASSEYILWGIPGENFGDVIIDVDARVVDPAGDADFGIICRYQDTQEYQNFYGLEISEDGYYAIWKFYNDEFTTLVDWQSSPLIDTSTPTHLTAACIGDTIALMVGDEILAEVQDRDLSSGDAGLVAGTWETPSFSVNFDNFVVTSPQE